MIHLFYSLIFFTSDNPEKMQHFSAPFIERLNSHGKIKFSLDNEIENKFFLNAELNGVQKNTEKSLLAATKKIKTYVLESQIEKAQHLSESEYEKLEESLLSKPEEISQPTLVNFYFWSAASHYKNDLKFHEYLTSFLGIATFSQRNILQSELPNHFYEYFDKSAFNQKNLHTNQHTLTNSESCDTYFNGQKIKNNFSLIMNQKGVLNSICKNGTFKTRFTSLEDSSVVIQPSIDKKIHSMLPIESFPVNLIHKKELLSLVLIYWSSEENYIQTVIVDPKDFSAKRELKLILGSKSDLNAAGDKIESFILKSEKSLLN